MPSIDLPAAPAAASSARRFARSTLEEQGITGTVLDDAELLVSELVTNAVLHAGTATRVDIDVRGQRVRISVFDGDSRLPQVQHYEPDAITGRGLLLVQRIARQWGAERLPNGKVVWFELDGAGLRRTDARLDA